jgi:hypothetical protein
MEKKFGPLTLSGPRAKVANSRQHYFLMKMNADCALGGCAGHYREIALLL